MDDKIREYAEHTLRFCRVYESDTRFKQSVSLLVKALQAMREACAEAERDHLGFTARAAILSAVPKTPLPTNEELQARHPELDEAGRKGLILALTMKRAPKPTEEKE